MMTEKTAGAMVTTASVNDRKISTSSTMMNRAAEFSTWLPVLPDAFCWSTWTATLPARWACSPAGSPAREMVARIESTRSVIWFWPPPAWLASTTSCHACPSGERPASMTLLTLATWPSWPFRLVTAVTSAAVSGAADRAATTGIGSRPAVPNGAARLAACWLGALSGRNLVLLFWVTLDSAGSSVAAAMAPATHTASTSQRKRTQNEPMARKIASICTCRTIRGPGDDLHVASRPGRQPGGGLEVIAVDGASRGDGGGISTAGPARTRACGWSAWLLGQTRPSPGAAGVFRRVAAGYYRCGPARCWRPPGPGGMKFALMGPGACP